MVLCHNGKKIRICKSLRVFPSLQGYTEKSKESSWDGTGQVREMWKHRPFKIDSVFEKAITYSIYKTSN